MAIWYESSGRGSDDGPTGDASVPATATGLPLESLDR